MKVKYFDKSLPEIGKIGGKSDWIDLYSRVNMFILEGQSAVIPLNVAIELPAGYEAHIVPRSSTFKNYGLIQTNHMGIVDESYCGDNDEWKMPVHCIHGIQYAYRDYDGGMCVVTDMEKAPKGMSLFKGTWIAAGDRLCQFRLMEHMPAVELETVDHLEGTDRGGFGTTGR